MNYLLDLNKKLKNHFFEVLRIKTTPHEIGLGFAVGTFLSILPTLGFAMILGLFLVSIYKPISKVSLILSMIVWNPLTLVPIYGLSFSIGDMLFDASPVMTFQFEWMNTVVHYTRRFLVGNLILAVSISPVSYLITRLIYVNYLSRVALQTRD